MKTHRTIDYKIGTDDGRVLATIRKAEESEIMQLSLFGEAEKYAIFSRDTFDDLVEGLIEIKSKIYQDHKPY